MRKVAEGQPCPLCELALAAHALEGISGDEHPLRLTISGLPVLRCPTGHVYFARRDLPLWLMNRLVEEDVGKLPAGRASGVLFKRHACGGCGRPLEGAGRRHGFRIAVACEGLPGFEVALEMPVFRCGACGREQVKDVERVRKLAPAALVHAFKAAAIKY